MAAIAYPTITPPTAPAVRTLRLVPAAEGCVALDRSVYVRRRLAVLAVLLVAVTGVLLVVRGLDAGGRTTASTAPGGGVLVHDLSAYGAAHESPPAGARYVVQPGDTLWSIAGRLVPTGDVRDEVDRLAGWNGGASLQAGQRLLVGPPAGG